MLREFCNLFGCGLATDCRMDQEFLQTSKGHHFDYNGLQAWIIIYNKSLINQKLGPCVTYLF